LNNSYKPFGGFSVFPPVIKNLLIINVVVFFIQMLANNLTIGGKPLWYVLNMWFALNPFGDGYNFQIWQLITYQFMHGSFTHILFNMFALWMFGMEIENYWGSQKFLIYYLLCGIAAGLFQLFLNPLLGAQPAVTIGASGAIYGVLIAFGLMFPDRYIFLYFLVPVKAKYLIGFLIVLEFMLVDSAQSDVAHLAHLGGAIAGFLFILFDKSIDVPLKRMLNISSGYGTRTKFHNPFSGLADKFKQRQQNIEDAKYYDINHKKEDEDISQAEIDAILDKISQSGYQNLSEREKRILFEASKKMN
jgi:membrane associated rhomboid family serine protease